MEKSFTNRKQFFRKCSGQSNGNSERMAFISHRQNRTVLIKNKNYSKRYDDENNNQVYEKNHI